MFFLFRKSLSEVTACLRERLHRWQQIEKLCGFPVVNNSGLPSLTASLYADHSWVVMPRVSVPPYPIAGGVDDLDEDTPPIIPQFTCKFFSSRSRLWENVTLNCLNIFELMYMLRYNTTFQKQAIFCLH